MIFKKTVDSCVKRLVDLEADLEGVISTYKRDQERRDQELNILKTKLYETDQEISRARRIQERIAEFVA